MNLKNNIKGVNKQLINNLNLSLEIINTTTINLNKIENIIKIVDRFFSLIVYL